ncbi:hypothetical protein [Desulfobacterium sp. N47]|uniref:4Fe-4S Wbl-type domain-containing protein n=1 Tax=uncultured Desulfobacterium sp. TaxID=201089 RepID=E1YB59_9BACT|nr:hypothetical protein N47_C17940 [uncultured Desulfobacterium sp.]
MTVNKTKNPECFGKIDIVFPMAENGLRCSPDSCLTCHLKTDCLKTAMNKGDGLKVREELTDRHYEAGMIGFFKRWSAKKELSRKIDEKNTTK